MEHPRAGEPGSAGALGQQDTSVNFVHSNGPDDTNYITCSAPTPPEGPSLRGTPPDQSKTTGTCNVEVSARVSVPYHV